MYGQSRGTQGLSTLVQKPGSADCLWCVVEAEWNPKSSALIMEVICPTPHQYPFQVNLLQVYHFELRHPSTLWRVKRRILTQTEPISVQSAPHRLFIRPPETYELYVYLEPVSFFVFEFFFRVEVGMLPPRGFPSLRKRALCSWANSSKDSTTGPVWQGLSGLCFQRPLDHGVVGKILTITSFARGAR